MTDNLPARFEEHNAGRVVSTRRRVPFELLYWEGCLNGSDAAQREKYLKTAWGKRYLKIVYEDISRGEWPMGEKAPCGQQDSRDATAQTMVGGALSAKSNERPPRTLLKMHVHLHVYSSNSR